MLHYGKNFSPKLLIRPTCAKVAISARIFIMHNTLLVCSLNLHLKHLVCMKYVFMSLLVNKSYRFFSHGHSLNYVNTIMSFLT